MKRLSSILTVITLLLTTGTTAQLCPGGGLDFYSAVAFDPGWVYGCNTGTSCNGGVHFDNRLSCQPTTALDACAPAPTCSNSAYNSSNIWFTFYPSASSVTLSAFQNTSFVVGLQAFSGSNTCASLNEIGCALAGGPSSGVNLILNGLTVGEKYYFRVYGSASSASQRTGIYCFCGTSGVEAVILPKQITSFTGTTSGKNILLKWNMAPDESDVSFVCSIQQRWLFIL